MAFKKIGVRIISFLGALGTGLQNYMGVVSFIQGLMSISYAAGKTGLAIIHSFAILLGGFCSTVVNYCINISLLEDFYERVTKKPRPRLEGWQKFRYYAGTGVFIGTGILFGLTALAFGPVGPLAVLGIIAGVFVAIIMIIQEVETWLKSFDNEAEVRKPLSQLFSEWKNSLTRGKVLGLVISIGNVIALSLLFTIGLCTFFMGIGVPALPALITSLTLAFTGGAFTEFYFYNGFLSNFCDKFKEKWQTFRQAPYPALGLTCAATNAVVNGVLAYTGVFMLTSILAAASIAAPPLGILVAVATVTALFAGSASFILGLDFWIDNSKKLKKFFNGTKKPEQNEADAAGKEGVHADKNTADIMKKIPASGQATPPPAPAVAEQPVTPTTKAKLLSLHFTPATSRTGNDVYPAPPQPSCIHAF